MSECLQRLRDDGCCLVWGEGCINKALTRRQESSDKARAGIPEEELGGVGMLMMSSNQQEVKESERLANMDTRVLPSEASSKYSEKGLGCESYRRCD